MHLHADRVYYEPKLLVNKLPDQLPPGVDPCQREVGPETAKSFHQFTWGLGGSFTLKQHWQIAYFKFK